MAVTAPFFHESTNLISVRPFFRHQKRGIVITSQGSVPFAELCAQIKKIGYAAAQKIRIYGEDFDVLSDPFPNTDGIAIEVRSRKTAQTRILQLPATVIHRGLQGPVRAA